MMVVESPSFFSAGRPTTEFGEIRIDLLAADEQHAAVAAGANGIAGLQRLFLFQRHLLRAVAASQTSPEDLLTDQTPSSAADASDAVAQDQRGHEGAPQFQSDPA